MILPVGIESFQELIKQRLDFVDKSDFIKEVLDDRGTKVAVITRPRRFGKTLNLSMLHHFLASEVNKKPTKGLFDHLKIAQCGDEYMQHQGKYPVISISLKDIRALDYESATLQLSKELSVLYSKHAELLSSQALSSQDKRDFEKILKREVHDTDMKSSLKDLTRYIAAHYNINPWVLIDEYDTPIQASYVNHYYDKMIDFMRGLLGAVLKSNEYLEKAVITGILRIAKESLFSGVNNLKVYSLLNAKYGQHFGFTEDEVSELLNKAHLSDKAEQVREWYNGYQIGQTVIYNPWSIVNCIEQDGETIPYWVNTSDNQLIKDLLKTSPIEFKQNMEFLVSGQPIEKFIDEGMVFHYLNNNPSSVWSLLLMAGYLKPVSTRQTDQGTFATLTIPNREIRNLYRQIIEQWLSNGYGIEWYNEFIDSLLTGHIDAFKKHLARVILQIASYHDFAKEPEAFYQGLMLGFTVSLHGAGTYEIQSNRESGLGRFDIMLIPKDNTQLGIILELKASTEKENLVTVAEDALRQIDEKHYTEAFQSRSIGKVMKIGIGFCGKQFDLCAIQESL